MVLAISPPEVPLSTSQSSHALKQGENKQGENKEDKKENKKGENRVALKGINWLAYQQILNALPQSRAARLTYDRGILEITMPLETHEYSRELIGLFIRIFSLEMGLKLKSMRSTTINRPDLARGVEPDCAFYIQNQPKVAGKIVDFMQDPPPDLVVEVDINHTDIDKNNLYASLGVPELWRFNGEELKIYVLPKTESAIELASESESPYLEYIECDRSPTFPLFQKEQLYNFLVKAEQDENAAEIEFRAMVKEILSQK